MWLVSYWIQDLGSYLGASFSIFIKMLPGGAAAAAVEVLDPGGLTPPAAGADFQLEEGSPPCVAAEPRPGG